MTRRTPMTAHLALMLLPSSGSTWHDQAPMNRSMFSFEKNSRIGTLPMSAPMKRLVAA